MKSMLLGGIAALAMGVTGAMAQSTTQPANTTPAATAATTSPGDFITKQQEGTVRAPKLVGVAVYDSNNKNVGKISDILLNKDGSVQAVVVGIGGFLGIGAKDIALPYNAIQWQTEQRTVAVNSGAPANNTNAATGMNTTTEKTNATAMNTTATTNNGATATKTVNPAKEEAYQGYPDRAVIAMSQDQLKNAPEFKYASNPASSENATAPAKQQ